ncbi:hypothetical protein JCM8547_001077 [Rhodosporidiobolus lusitaniae]
MLLSLPTELVEPIVRPSLPEGITGNTYAERQATLRALCLVSKKLHDVVQPILERMSSRLRFLVAVQAAATWKQLATVLPRLTALRELRLGTMTVDLSIVEALPNLQTLVLFHVHCEPWTTVAFRGVTELTFHESTVEDDLALLTAAAFPALEILNVDYDTFTMEPLDDLLLDRLTTLRLLNADAAPTCLATSRRLVICTFFKKEPAVQVSRIKDSIQAHTQSKTSVSTMYLPRQLFAPGGTPESTQEALLEACRTAGVEVVLHDAELQYGMVVAPLAFVEFARERKAWIEAEKAEQGQQ